MHKDHFPVTHSSNIHGSYLGRSGSLASAGKMTVLFCWEAEQGRGMNRCEGKMNTYRTVNAKGQDVWVTIPPKEDAMPMKPELFNRMVEALQLALPHIPEDEPDFAETRMLVEQVIAEAKGERP